MPTANEDIADAVVSHRLHLLRYEAGTVAALHQAVTDALGSVERELVRQAKASEAGKAVSASRRRRLIALQGELAAKAQQLGPELQELMQLSLVEAGDSEARFVFRLLSDNLPPSVALMMVPDAAVALATGSPLGGWSTIIARDLFDAQDRIQRILAQSLALGSSIPNVAKALKHGSGVVETYKGRLTTIARTEIQRVANEVAGASYMANADVIGSKQYLATLDSRTCLRCAPLHNQVYSLNDPEAPTLPLHPRCRCFYAPVTKSWADLGLGVADPREARRYDGSLAENMDFDQWLARQPEAVQREILPGRKWAMWKQGVPLERFSDSRKVLNLGELRALGVGPPKPTPLPPVWVPPAASTSSAPPSDAAPTTIKLSRAAASFIAKGDEIAGPVARAFHTTTTIKQARALEAMGLIEIKRGTWPLTAKGRRARAAILAIADSRADLKRTVKITF